jgi:hypothetical protein
MRAEIVPYGAYRAELVPDPEGDGGASVKIPVERDEKEDEG